MSAVLAAVLQPATLSALIDGSIQAVEFLNSQIAMYQQGDLITEAQLSNLAQQVAANTKATTQLLNAAMAAKTPVTPSPVASDASAAPAQGVAASEPVPTMWGQAKGNPSA